MITSVAFTVYPVTDMARSRAFYEGVLGLTKGDNYQNEWMEYEVGEATFAITTVDMGHTAGAKGAVIGFEVADFDPFVQELKQKEVPFVVALLETPICRMAVIEDPDRNHITLHKRHGG